MIAMSFDELGDDFKRPETESTHLSSKSADRFVDVDVGLCAGLKEGTTPLFGHSLTLFKRHLSPRLNVGFVADLCDHQSMSEMKRSRREEALRTNEDHGDFGEFGVAQHSCADAVDTFKRRSAEDRITDNEAFRRLHPVLIKSLSFRFVWKKG